LKWFSDKIYWQVADQPGKEGPNYLVMVDLVDKEEKRIVILEPDEEKKKKKTVGTYLTRDEQAALTSC
jgi:hypothetical protein